MRVLYATMSVVEFDGTHYYSNPVQATYPRYVEDGDELTIICHKKDVKEGKQDLITRESVHFAFVKKINSIRSILTCTFKKNGTVIEEEVKKADICFIHIPCPHCYQVIKYARKYNKPFMTIVCGCTWDEYWTYDWRGKIIAPFAYLGQRISQKKAQFSIYVTNVFLQRRYPNCGKSIGCSNVNIETGIPGILEKRLDHIKEVSKNRDIVLKIGTVAAIDVPYKGQGDVIKAIALLRKKGILIEYHLLGRGSREALSKIAKLYNVEDFVVFHNPVPHNEVLAFYDSIDAYIQSSWTEGLPRALIEAMSRGCLCIGSNAGGIPELLDSDYIYPKGNVKALSAIISEIKVETMIDQAQVNYVRAKEFDRNVLNKRRSEFIKEFRTACFN